MFNSDAPKPKAPVEEGDFFTKRQGTARQKREDLGFAGLGLSGSGFRGFGV